jgi:purine-nucleoside phosphorylase
MSTPHNSANPGDIAKLVLMPGDPLRAKMVADTYLEDVVCFNQVRGMYGFTGTYKGNRVSVMGSGMGMPSIGIYSYELYHMYDVENIIRVGSAGLIDKSLKIRSLVAAMSAYTNSSYGAQFKFRGNLAPCASYDLLSRAVEAAKDRGMPISVGPVYSSDTFYDEDPQAETLQKLGVLAVEMEAYALYLNAARARKNALALLTISDNPYTGETCTAQEGRETFTQMMEIALEIA